jgi:hypothetical protein
MKPTTIREVAARKRIPNFDTISTVIDRLSVEVVKKSHFEFLVETGALAPAEANKKIELQDAMIAGLRSELRDLLVEAFTSGKYDFIEETRTFS